MADMVNDLVFGNMEYNHGWYKAEKINFWGEDVEVRVVASSFGKKEINQSQRDNYQFFKSTINDISRQSMEALKKYLSENARIYEIEPNADLDYARIKQLVTPGTIIFQSDGSFGILCDSPLDEEHGIGIQVKPNYEVGPQDILL
jgi:hypothetical protein